MEIEIRVRVGEIDEARKVIDALALLSTTTGPGPVQIDLPPADEKPAPKARRTPRATEKAAPAPQVAEPIKANGEDIEDDEKDDALRAQVAFESKRVARVLGIGAMRSAIRQVTGESILQVDDVSAAHLPALLTALQGL